jgi:exonuclease VII small subunit
VVNTDLGVAHGRIRIDVDDKGSAAATAVLIKMQAQFEQMNKQLAKIEKSLSSTDHSLNETSVAFDRASKSSKRFGASLFDTNKSIKSFISDAQDLQETIQGSVVAYNRINYASKKAADALRFFNAIGGETGGKFRKFRTGLIETNTLLSKNSKELANWNENIQTGVTWVGKLSVLDRFSASLRDNAKALAGTRSAIAMAGVGYFTLRDKLYGVNSAIDNSPNWVRKMNAFAGSLKKATFAFTAFGAALWPLTKMEQLIGTQFTRRVVGSLGLIGDKTNSLGRIFAKVFGPGAYRPFVQFSQKIADFGANFDKHLTNAATKATRLKASVDKAKGSFKGFVTSFGSVATGAALLGSAVNDLWGRFQWFFKIPKPLMAGMAIFFSRILPSALYGVRKLMQGMSNLVAGLWDGIKQLTGGLTAVPGLFAGIGTAVTSLMFVFKGLSKVFKDVFSTDPTVAAEAFAKLPEHLKPMAKAIQDVLPGWRELQQLSQIEMFRGIEDQIKALSEGYLPLVTEGVTNVVAAFRRMKDSAVGVLLEKQTRADAAGVYNDTAGAINNAAKATGPFIAGLRDMIAVGMNFFRGMSAWLPTLSQKFAEWASINRNNGQMMKWMQEAKNGVYDLTKGLMEGLKAAYEFLTVFQTRSEDNWLKRFNVYMTELNKSTNESKISGWLADMRRGLEGMGTKKLEDLNQLFKLLKDTVMAFAPMIQKLSDTFSGVFLHALTACLHIINTFVEVLHSLGLDIVIGYVLGLAGAFTMLPKAVQAAWTAIKGLWGTLLIFKNSDKVFKGLNDGAAWLSLRLEKLGDRGKKVGDGLEKVTEGITGMASGIMKFLGIAAAVGTTLLVLKDFYDNAASRYKAFDAQLEKNSQSLVTFKDNLRDAFTADAGFMGNNVMTAISNGLADMMTNVEDTAAQAPGMFAHVEDAVKRTWDAIYENKGNVNGGYIFGKLFEGDSQELDNMQTLSEKAQIAAKGLKELRDKGDDLKAILASSDGDYKTYIDNLRKQGDQGNITADELDKVRDALQKTKAEAAAVGPASMQVSEGLKLIAESGGNATQALDGLKKVLQGLGILKTDALDAAMAYGQALDDLATKANGFKTEADSSGKALLNAAGGYNEASQAGRDFYGTMKSLGDAFMTQAIQSKDAAGTYAQFETQLQSMSGTLGIPIEKLKELAQQVGITPKNVDIMIALRSAGGGPMTNDIANFLVQARAMLENGNLEAPVKFNPEMPPEEVAKQVNNAVGRVVAKVDGGVIEIDPRVQTSELDQVMQLLANKGVQVPGGPAPQKSEIPVGVKGDVTGSDEFFNSVLDNLNKTKDAAKTAGAETATGFNTAVTENADPDLFSEQMAIIQGEIDKLAPYDSGAAFTGDFAAGIISRISDVNAAAIEVAAAAAQAMPGSPAKKGPLSGKGWTMVRGKSFSRDFATGISSGAGGVGQSALDVAGAAGAGLQNTKAYQAGQFLGQLTELNSFFSNAVSAFTKIAEAAFGMAKMVSDPLGQGTFFGKNLGFRRDPSISDAQLAQQRADAAQGRVNSFYGSGSRPDLSASDAKEGGKYGLKPGTDIRMGEKGFPDWVYQVGKQFGIEASTYAGHQEKGSKGENQGIDWWPTNNAQMNPGTKGYDPAELARMDAFAEWIAHQPGTEQVIWENPLTGKRVGYANGKDVSQTSYYEKDWKDHLGHVHTRQTKNLELMGQVNAATAATAEEMGMVEHAAIDATTKIEDLPNAVAPNYGAPFDPATAGTPSAPAQLVTIGKNGEFVPVHGSGADPGTPETINKITGKPWTPEEAAAYFQENPLQYDASQLKPGDTATDGLFQGTQEQQLEELKKQNSTLNDIYNTDVASMSETQAIAAATELQNQASAQTALDTPASRALAGQLSSKMGEITSEHGLAENQNPIDQAAGIASGMTSIASDVFAVIGSAIEAAGAAKGMADTLVRGVSNTEDIYKMVDQVQVFIKLAADVAGAASSIAGTAGSMTGGMDMGITSGVASVLGMVQAGLEAANAVIDLGQQAYRIIGSYVGDFLGYLTGGAGGQLAGNVKYLLDEKTNELLAYSVDNAGDKRAHNLAGQYTDPSARNQQIGQINVYGGPGQDPRDSTRQMMFQVRASQFAAATGQ